jgi:arsenite methyltransferase
VSDESPTEVRELVSRAYANAVKMSARACCGPVPKGTLARRAGYGDEELAALPPDAAGIDIVLAGKKVGPTGRVIGVDMTDEMIEKARATIAEAGLTNAEVRKGLIEELPIESASVDWVISNCVINLSPEKSRVFAEIARVLKPGGGMIVSDVIAEGLPEAVLEDLRYYSSCVSGALSEAEYREGLESVGLVAVAIRKKVELDLPQVEALLESDRRAYEGCRRGEDGRGEAVKAAGAIAATCAGKVWAAEINARKPAS